MIKHMTSCIVNNIGVYGPLLALMKSASDRIPKFVRYIVRQENNSVIIMDKFIAHCCME
jgi:hypothetical protein